MMFVQTTEGMEIVAPVIFGFCQIIKCNGIAAAQDSVQSVDSDGSCLSIKAG